MLCRGFLGVGWRPTMVVGVVVLGGLGEAIERWLGGAGRGGEPRRALYRRGKAVRGEKSSRRPGGRLGRGATTDLEWRRDELLVQAR
jgi:hypothetical protein